MTTLSTETTKLIEWQVFGMCLSGLTQFADLPYVLEQLEDGQSFGHNTRDESDDTDGWYLWEPFCTLDMGELLSVIQDYRSQLTSLAMHAVAYA